MKTAYKGLSQLNTNTNTTVHTRMGGQAHNKSRYASSSLYENHSVGVRRQETNITTTQNTFDSNTYDKRN